MITTQDVKRAIAKADGFFKSNKEAFADRIHNLEVKMVQRMGSELDRLHQNIASMEKRILALEQEQALYKAMLRSYLGNKKSNG